MKVFDVVAVVGKYTNSSGEEKSRYLNIGAVIQTKKGQMLKLESVPVGWDGWAYLNEPKPKEDRPQNNKQGAPKHKPNYHDDDIPY